MHDQLRRFASGQLAIAAYNAASGAVERCMCIPPFPETQDLEPDLALRARLEQRALVLERADCT
jgi:hypothetical protein